MSFLLLHHKKEIYEISPEELFLEWCLLTPSMVLDGWHIINESSGNSIYFLDGKLVEMKTLQEILVQA